MEFTTTAYTTIQNEDGTYEWKRLTKNSDGAAPFNGAPQVGGDANPGESDLYARSDHRHPIDTTKQVKLVSGDNIKTVNLQELLGPGDLIITEIEDGDDNIIESISINGTSQTITDKNVNLQIKTINGQSLWGDDNIKITKDFEYIHFGSKKYRGTQPLTINIYNGEVR